MAGERETTYGMTTRWFTPAMPPHPDVPGVALRNVGQVGVALAVRLVVAGYEVVGVGVVEDCVRQFQDAGGLVLASDSEYDDVIWEIECHERPDVQPEVLARITEHYRGYGRPRLEFHGASRVVESGRDATIGALVVRSGVESALADGLQVALDVSPRGLQLIIRGERTLFEAALPLLTVLADRVLYAGQVEDDLNENETLACDLPPHGHA